MDERDQDRCCWCCSTTWVWWNSAVSCSLVRWPRASSMNLLAARQVTGKTPGLDRVSPLALTMISMILSWAPPVTWIVSLTEPSARAVSVHYAPGFGPRTWLSRPRTLAGTGRDAPVAPPAIEVVELDLAGGQVGDDWIGPIRQLHGRPSTSPLKSRLCLAPARAGLGVGKPPGRRRRP